MPTDPRRPGFDVYCRWLASTDRRSGYADDAAAATEREARYETLITAARTTRYSVPRYLEALPLAAAAERSSATHLPEMITARGFRVTISYEDGSDRDSSSLCVLVRCPTDLAGQLEGETAYLWNGTERFELGQFDADGNAIGTLPAGIQITQSDLSSGHVKLDEPQPNDA